MKQSVMICVFLVCLLLSLLAGIACLGFALAGKAELASVMVRLIGWAVTGMLCSGLVIGNEEHKAK